MTSAYMIAWKGTYDAKNHLMRVATAPWALRCKHHGTSRSKTHEYADGTGENQARAFCPQTIE
eukprot:6213009-Pleurochrysis_carterae.AAC.2